MASNLKHTVIINFIESPDATNKKAYSNLIFVIKYMDQYINQLTQNFIQFSLCGYRLLSISRTQSKILIEAF